VCERERQSEKDKDLCRDKRGEGGKNKRPSEEQRGGRGSGERERGGQRGRQRERKREGEIPDSVLSLFFAFSRLVEPVLEKLPTVVIVYRPQVTSRNGLHRKTSSYRVHRG